MKSIAITPDFSLLPTFETQNELNALGLDFSNSPLRFMLSKTHYYPIVDGALEQSIVIMGIFSGFIRALDLSQLRQLIPCFSSYRMGEYWVYKPHGMDDIMFEHENEAEACARLLLFLKKRGFKLRGFV
jgi:hypothetical protein